MWYTFAKKQIVSGRRDIEQMYGPEVYAKVKDCSPKTQPVAAFFLSKAGPLTPKSEDVIRVCHNLDGIFSKKNIPLVVSKDKIVFNGESYTADYWLQFSQSVDAIHSIMFPPKIEDLKKSEEDLPYQDGVINVVKIHNMPEAVQYGNGTTWCISQPFNGMWQSYRTRQASTFYFVFDGTRPEDDPLRRVSVDATKNGILLTDIHNDTGYISEFDRDVDAYLKYLAERGVDISQFKNDPLTKEERAENQQLGNRISSLEAFKKLATLGIPNVYSKYISYGHQLTAEQFEFMMSFGNEYLINQYLNTGRAVPRELKHLLNAQQLKTYNRVRERYLDHLLQNAQDDDESYTVSAPDHAMENLPDLMDTDLFYKLIDMGASAKTIYRQTKNRPEILAEVYQKVPKFYYSFLLEAMYGNNIRGLMSLYSIDPDKVIPFIETFIRRNEFSNNYNSELLNKLYDMTPNHNMFIIPALRLWRKDEHHTQLFEKLRKDGLLDQMMLILLTDDDLVSSTREMVPILLKHGASVDQAWKILCSQWSNVPTQPSLDIYRAYARAHPEKTQDEILSEIPSSNLPVEPDTMRTPVKATQPISSELPENDLSQDGLRKD